MADPHGKNSKIKVISMSRDNKNDCLVSLRNKTKGQVTRAFLELKEYETHAERHLANLNQRDTPLVTVSVPWIPSTRLQEIHRHLDRANDICSSSTITQVFDYSKEIREAAEIAQSYQKILADVNYMARWVDKVNQKFLKLDKTLEHPECMLTHPAKLPSGSFVKASLNSPVTQLEEYRLPDQPGVWDYSNQSTHWPRREKLEKLTTRIKRCSLRPEPFEPQPWVESKAWSAARRRKADQVPNSYKEPLTTEGSQAQSCKPTSILSKQKTSQKSYAEVTDKK